MSDSARSYLHQGLVIKKILHFPFPSSQFHYSLHFPFSNFQTHTTSNLSTLSNSLCFPSPNFIKSLLTYPTPSNPFHFPIPNSFKPFSFFTFEVFSKNFFVGERPKFRHTLLNLSLAESGPSPSFESLVCKILISFDETYPQEWPNNFSFQPWHIT
eukprot:TRINITY_DN36546_c0_g1_i2.p1 TRINITY_DN36546_c0_g1~~TRINITY_DN36546_c0_g1_i2.p1  ORF type:complete len:156 (+),score=7.66 TRINITY_DN36546_c0_g1_i2:423-890(+)